MSADADIARTAAINVVVIVHQGLGDVIMTLPLFRLVDEALPAGSRIHAVLSSPVEESILRLVQWRTKIVAHYLGDRRDIIALSRTACIAARLRALRPAVLLAPHAPPTAMWSFFARVVGARCSVGPAGPFSSFGFSAAIASREDEHKVEYFARHAAAAGFVASPLPNLTMPPIDNNQIDHAATVFEVPGPGENWVTLAPETKSAKQKRWPVNRFRELISRLLQDDASQKIGLFGAPSERPALEEVRRGFDINRVRIFAHPSIPAALAVLRRSVCHVSACTGAVHLPSLVNTPVVGLYGPTNPDFTGPYHSRAYIVRLELDCAPCYRPGFQNGCATPICMTQLDVDRVYWAVKEMAEGKSPPVHPRIYTKNSFGPPETALLAAR